MIPTNTLNSQEELYTLLDANFKSGFPQFATVDAYNQQDQSKGRLLNHHKGGKGIEDIKAAIKTAIELNSHYVDVFLFSSEKAAHSRPATSFRVFLNKKAEEEIKNEEPKINDYFNTPQHAQEQFNGLGGLGELMSVKERLFAVEFDKKRYKYELDLANAKIADLDAENQKLDKENDELNGLNNELIEKNKELQKYVPGESKFLGLDPTALLGAVTERALIGIVKKSPGTAKAVLGLSEEQYQNFLGDVEQSEKEDAKPIETTKAEVEFEATENLTPEQKQKKAYSDGVAKWLFAMSNEDIRKFGKLIEYFREDYSKIDTLLELINE